MVENSVLLNPAQGRTRPEFYKIRIRLNLPPKPFLETLWKTGIRWIILTRIIIFANSFEKRILILEQQNTQDT